MLKSEKETVITFDSGSEIVQVYSCHGSVWRKLDAAGFTPVRSHAMAGREVARTYRVPKDCFRFRVVPENRPRRPAPKTAFRRKTSDKKSGK